MSMKKAIVLAAALLGPLWIDAPAEAGTIVSQHFQSAALGRDWTYNVYLPDGYDSGKIRYPVFYLLHGNGADENEWVVDGAIQQTADEMMRRGDIPPAVIVMPSASTTWYVDRKEKMETAIIQDLVPEVEKTFRVMNDRAGRVIGGESMGGYGALRFVLKYPEMFAAAALMSPAIYVPEPPPASSARRVGVFGTADQFDAEVWKSLNYPGLLEAFFAKKIVMPLYIDSGDHDDFMIEGQAPQLYEIWREHKQPAELRITGGTHSFGVWKKTVHEAMRFVFETVRRPELAP
jgi:S-formylglutathione hydrolase FrmB